jgi:hypothetical protein
MSGFQNGGGPSAGGVDQPGFGGNPSGFGGFDPGTGVGTCLSPDDTASYSFTISGGTVTAVTRTDGTHTSSVALSSADSFVVGSGSVTETITGTTSTESVTYTLESGSSSAYQITSETLTVTSPSTTTASGDTLSYGFTVSSGSVTAETVTFTHGTGTTTRTITPPSDAVFTVGGSSITETWAQGDQLVTVTYVQPSGSTGYAVSSQQVTVIPEGTATTALSVAPSDRASFTIDSSGTITAVSAIKPDGSSATVTVPSTVTYTQLASGFVEETITHGSDSRYVVFYEGSGSSSYTEVAHGTGTVDLTGLKAQLADLPSAVLALL